MGPFGIETTVRTACAAASERKSDARRVAPARRHDADQRLRLLAEIIGPLAQSLGAHCEIVLHDYRIPDHSVVAVAGKVTQRRIGSAMSEIGLSILAEGDSAKDRLNYLAKAPNGRIVNSSTIVLRDRKQKVFGALCINMDVTAIRHAAAILDQLSGDFAEPRPTTFANDVGDVIDAALREVLAGRAATLLSREERLEAIRVLNTRGIFNIKRAMGQVASALGISRATAYGCLQTARSETAAAKKAFPANGSRRRIPNRSG
jgi:predicted transcriptional regulator YheO